jgi:hypothetical protein
VATQQILQFVKIWRDYKKMQRFHWTFIVDILLKTTFLKAEVKVLAQDIESEKILAAQAADDMVNWEEQTKACSETRNLVGREKINLENLRSDLHKRQVRAEQVARTTKGRISYQRQFFLGKQAVNVHVG